MAARRDPHEVFSQIENILQIPRASNPKSRCQTIWARLQARWMRRLSREELRSEFNQSKQLLKLVAEEIFSKRYRQANRARWVCMAKTLLRIDAGLLCLLLHSNRRHFNLILRVGPISIHLLAVLVKEQGSCWDPVFSPLLRRYLEPIEELSWREGGDADSKLGMASVRFALSHKKPHIGYDQKQQYASGWAAHPERDHRHDLDSRYEKSADFGTARARFFRNWPLHSLFLLILQMGPATLCALREDWGLRHFKWPL